MSNLEKSSDTAADQPVILVFCCHYCAYAAADLAGTMRLQYPGDVRILRLPCTGKIEVNYILAAFERGVDGVIVAGCLEGGCHFQEGNLRARRRVERAKQMLAEIGLEPERLEMFNLSSAEGTRFAEIVNEMSQRIHKLGRSPLRRSGCEVSGLEAVAPSTMSTVSTMSTMSTPKTHHGESS